MILAVAAEGLLAILLLVVARDNKGSTLCMVLWSIGMLYWFLMGFLSFYSPAEHIKSYCRQAGISMEVLNAEAEAAEKLHGVYLGKQHLFFSSATSMAVIPYASLTRLELVRKGHNPAKGRPGALYLYFKGTGIEKNISAYFAVLPQAEAVIQRILQFNPAIQVIYG